MEQGGTDSHDCGALPDDATAGDNTPTSRVDGRPVSDGVVSCRRVFTRTLDRNATTYGKTGTCQRREPSAIAGGTCAQGEPGNRTWKPWRATEPLTRRPCRDTH